MSRKTTSILSDSESEEEYIVEAIRRWRFNLRENRYEYYIKWKGYKEEENTWEPKENLTNCPEKLERFEKAMEKQERRLYKSKNPKSLTGFQRRAGFIQCIGADGPHESDTEENSKKPDKQKFYCLIRFDDSDFAEEVTMKEFFRHRPKEAFQFFEQRLLRRDKSSS